FAFRARERPQEMHLRVADGLDAFVGEVVCEPAQRQTGAVHRRLADDPFHAAAAGNQPHVQRGAMLLEKLFNRDRWMRHVKNWVNGVMEQWTCAMQAISTLQCSNTPSLRFS